MENQKASVKKIALSHGLILALLTIGVSVIIYVLGMHYDQSMWQTLANTAIMIVVIVYGLKAYKKDNGGFLSLGEALKTGLAISLVAGIIGVIYNYIFMNFVEPDFVTNMMDISRDKMIEQNPDMTEDQMEMGIGMMEKMMSPGIMGAIGIIASLFFGFIFSLISGLVLKQNKPEHLQ